MAPSLRRPLVYVAVVLAVLALILVKVELLASSAASHKAATKLLSGTELDELERAVAQNSLFTGGSGDALKRLYAEYRQRKEMGHPDAVEPLFAARNGLIAARSLIFPRKAALWALEKRLTQMGKLPKGSAQKAHQAFPAMRLLSLLLMVAWIGGVVLFLTKGISRNLTLSLPWAARGALLYSLSFMLWIITLRQ